MTLRKDKKRKEIGACRKLSAIMSFQRNRSESLSSTDDDESWDSWLEMDESDSECSSSMQLERDADAGGGRRVRFNEFATVHIVPFREDAKSHWFLKRERETLKDEVITTVNKMRQICAPYDDSASLDQFASLDPDVYCVRGLEHLKSVAYYERRSMMRGAVRNGVMEEQRRQRARGQKHLDEEKIAKVSRDWSRWSRELARGIGERDEVDAKQPTDRQSNCNTGGTIFATPLKNPTKRPCFEARPIEFSPIVGTSKFPSTDFIFEGDAMEVVAQS